MAEPLFLGNSSSDSTQTLAPSAPAQEPLFLEKHTDSQSANPSIWDHIMAQLAAGAPGTYGASASRLKAPEDLSPEERQNASKVISAIMGTATMGPLAGILSGLTTKTPGDAAATLAAGSIPGLNTANRGYNAIAGLLRGYLMSKGGDAARAAVNQKEMPSMSPDPTSLISAGLGAVGGLATGTPKLNPKVVLANAEAARDQLKPTVGKLLRERDAAQQALDSAKAATQKQLQNALTKAQEARDNAKVVGFEDYHNNQVAQAKADLEELQNKDFTQTAAGQRLAKAEQDLAPVSDQYMKHRAAVAAAKQAVKTADPDLIQKFLDAALHHGAGALAGGILGNTSGHSIMSTLAGMGLGMAAPGLANTPGGRQTLQAAPQLIPGLSNFQANQ